MLFGPLCRSKMVLTVAKLPKVAKEHIDQARASGWPWYSGKQLPSVINTIYVPGQPAKPGRCQYNKELKPHVVHILRSQRWLQVTLNLKASVCQDGRYIMTATRRSCRSDESRKGDQRNWFRSSGMSCGRGCPSPRVGLFKHTECHLCFIAMLQASSSRTQAVYTSHRKVSLKPQTGFLWKRKTITRLRYTCTNVGRPNIGGGAVKPQQSRQDNKQSKVNKDQQQTRQTGEFDSCEKVSPGLHHLSQQVVSAQVCLKQNELCSLPPLAPSEVA